MAPPQNSDKPKRKRIVIKKGDIFKIDLNDGSHCYAHIGKHETIFYDYKGQDDLSLSEITKLKTLFRVWVYNYVPRTENWSRIGNLVIEDLDVECYFYKVDPISGDLYLYHSEFSENNYERKATASEIKGLEKAAVWAENHIEDRLRDHYAGRPCKWMDGWGV